MPVQQWSDEIILVEMASEPQFSEDLAGVNDRLDNRLQHVVLNMAGVRHLNSSNLAQLLRVRKRVEQNGYHFSLCSVPDGVWGVMLVTGLDKIFTLAEDVPSALASMQLDEPDSP